MLNEPISIVRNMLRARGVTISRLNPTEGLLLPPDLSDSVLSSYKEILDHYAARLLLKEVIKSQNSKMWLRGRSQVERFCDPKAVDDFLSRLVELKVIRISADGTPVTMTPLKSFGPTYEWYTAQVLFSDFGCPAIWNVTLENLGSGGDHDVISSLSGHFLYLEVKTSPPGRIESPEMSGFVRRLFDMAPDLAVFINDTHLRMKDKIVPMMEKEIEEFRVQGSDFREGQAEDILFERLEREIFHLGSAIYIINSKPDLKRNLEVVFRHYFRKSSKVLEAIT